MKNILKTNKKCVVCPCPLAKEQVPAMHTLLLGTTTAPCSLWQPSCHQHAGRSTGGSWTRRSIVPVPPWSPNSISCPRGEEGYVLLTALCPSSPQRWVTGAQDIAPQAARGIPRAAEQEEICSISSGIRVGGCLMLLQRVGTNQSCSCLPANGGVKSRRPLRGTGKSRCPIWSLGMNHFAPGLQQ